MKFLYTFLLLPVFWQVAAQPSLSDSAFYRQSVNSVLNGYRKDIGENLHLYNGAEYLRTGHGVKGTAFFETDSLLPTSIFYDGKLYEEVPALYDLVTDNLVIKNYALNNEIQLVREKIDYFMMPQHLFIRITADSATPASLRTGFYEKLYDGKLSVFARREKLAKLSGRAAENDNRYTEYNYYFVLLNNTFYRVNDKKELLSLLGSRKEEVNDYIKNNRINFKKKPEESLVKIAGYYSASKN